MKCTFKDSRHAEKKKKNFLILDPVYNMFSIVSKCLYMMTSMRIHFEEL
jgi:hypothetical protein